MKILIIAHKDEDTSKIKNRVRGYEYVVVRDLCKKKIEDEICIGKFIGKGEAVRYGLNSLNDDVLILDFDADVNSRILKKVENELKKYDVIYGIRIYKRRKLYRKILSKIYKILVKILYPELYYIKDFQAGFKAISKRYLKFIRRKLVLNGFSYDVNLLYYSRFFRVKGIRILWKEEKGSFSKRIIGNVFRMFLELLYFRLRSLS